MKKSIFLAVAAVAMTACSNDVDLGLKDANKQDASNAIGFQVLNKNMSRATLQEEGHYNFGVFAYKSTDATNNIMNNYLVGFFGTGVGYQKFGDRTTTDGMTSTDKNLSSWGYEGLGFSQYVADDTHIFESGYYNPTANPAYMSNVDSQYVRYWDKDAETTNFYAYAPYIKGANTVTYDNVNHIMKFPVGAIQDGVDDKTTFEYMYAAEQVERNNYGKAVQLSFNRLNAKVNITFYEDIPGYGVILEKLVDGTVDISAAPAKESASTLVYSAGLRRTAGATLTFSGTKYTDASIAYTYGKDDYATGEYLSFALPNSHAEIATKKADALVGGSAVASSYSPTTYYAIPKEDANECGLTFHVSFTLKSNTGETILVRDARVFVPASYCKWKANHAYTYVFRITKDATGSTDPTVTPDPADPGKGTQSLYPIVFDNVTVEDWTPATDTETGNDHNIN